MTYALDVGRARSVTLLACLVAYAIGASPASGQDAAQVFERYAPFVWKVEVVEAQTSAPQSIGTAFVVGTTGHLVTNYHVVVGYLENPADLRIQLVNRNSVTPITVYIAGIDPVNDLAILTPALESELGAPAGLRLEIEPVAVGTRLFSLGHPADLSTSVVEGTYNGAVSRSGTPRIHFTGSVNPGMSGGPTITVDGRVVGINVSTAGNQLSFLIPSREARVLLEEAVDNPRSMSSELKNQAARKIDEFQEEFYRELLSSPLERTDLGSYSVPTLPVDTFDCSATPWEIANERYRIVQYRCRTGGDILMSGGAPYPILTLEHLFIAAGELNNQQFHSLYSNWFQTVYDWEVPDQEMASDFECERQNVEDESSLALKTTFCARRHEGKVALYDVFIRAAPLSGARQGIVTTVTAFGISFGNARDLAGALLRGFSWTG